MNVRDQERGRVVWIHVACPQCWPNSRALRRHCDFCGKTGRVWKTVTRQEADDAGLDFHEGEEPPK